MADPAISDPDIVSRLCVDCGYCCSGVLFDHTSHDPDEDDFVRSIGMKLVPVKDGKKQGIAQPCPQLACSACSIYGQRRPRICGEYFCKLACALGCGETDFASARAIVANARSLLDQIEPLLEEGEDIVEDIVAARRRWLAQSGGEWRNSAVNARFHLLMTSLNLLLGRHFLRDDQKYMSFEMGE